MNPSSTETPTIRRFKQLCINGLLDPRLSLPAKGALATLLADSDLRPNVEFLNGVCPDSRHAVQKALKELERYGYLKRVLAQGVGGRALGKRNSLVECPDPDFDKGVES